MSKIVDENTKFGENSECPVCSKSFTAKEIETHVNRCIFLNTSSSSINENKRSFNIFSSKKSSSPSNKKPKLELKTNNIINTQNNNKVLIDLDDDVEEVKNNESLSRIEIKKSNTKLAVPLAEQMRPDILENYIGQNHIIDKSSVMRTVLESNEIPSMILWGPPGCGKTTLAHIIANRCKGTQNSRFVKLSATMCGVNDVKEIVKVAKNDAKFKRKTILFMDEIHRFNKLQQDTFLPHVENGTITLIGATTENPSFSLNSALLSRCRVIVLEKLEIQHLYKILVRALQFYETVVLDDETNLETIDLKEFTPKMAIDKKSIEWLASMCDGDARIALNTLQLTMQTIEEQQEQTSDDRVKLISLESLKDGIKKSHMLYDRKGDQHYDTISALHKSIRASDDNAALYWCTRMMEGGEDPRYICRRLIRAASEDIGLADPQAIVIAMSALHSVQQIGMPEADCIIAQCAVYLARAPKSREMDSALAKCKADIKSWKGSLPSVPLHLRNAPTKLMKNLGYGQGYNMKQKNESNLQYMPEGMEDRNYFSE